MARFFLSYVSLFIILHVAQANRKWTFGVDLPGSQKVFAESGVMQLWEKNKDIQVKVPACMELVVVEVDVNNLLATPDVRFDWNTRVVSIYYSFLESSFSSYNVVGRAVPVVSNECQVVHIHG